MNDLSYNDPLYVIKEETKLTEDEAVDTLRKAWFSIFNQYPSNKALAVLVAQSCLESGRWAKIQNYNFGNLKRSPDYKFTMFATGENIWNQKLRKSEWHWFEPPHYQTAFRAYDSAIDGAKDYILFLSNRNSSEAWRNAAYKKAFDFLTQGMPKEYSLALYEAKYYTANPDVYTAGVVRIFNEFMTKIDKKYPDKTQFLKNSAIDELSRITPIGAASVPENTIEKDKSDPWIVMTEPSAPLSQKPTIPVVNSVPVVAPSKVKAITNSIDSHGGIVLLVSVIAAAAYSFFSGIISWVIGFL